jgi:hypothetical protein
MKRGLAVAFALAALTSGVSASSGFSCEAADKNVVKLVVEGATPRSGGSLINFGAALELEAGSAIEFKQPDVKGFTWNARALKVRIAKRANNESVEVVVDAMRNKNDEDEYTGSYAVRAGKLIKSGKVKCSVE